MSYKEMKMNIKYLTEKLWEYWNASDRNEIEEKEVLRKEFFELFDMLEGPEENFHHVQEIRAKITRDMDSNDCNMIEAASYTRDLVFYGYK